MYDAVLFIALRVALRPSTPSVYYNFNNTVNAIRCEGYEKAAQYFQWMHHLFTNNRKKIETVFLETQTLFNKDTYK